MLNRRIMDPTKQASIEPMHWYAEDEKGDPMIVDMTRFFDWYMALPLAY